MTSGGNPAIKPITTCCITSFVTGKDIDMLKNHLQKLFSLLFSAPKKVVPPAPVAICYVGGVLITLEKKQGVLRTSRKPGGETNTPASEDFFYEIVVTTGGNNPEYPASSMVARFTTALSPQDGCGYTDKLAYAPAGSYWLNFELLEEFHDGLKEGVLGRPMPAHHRLCLRGNYIDASGKPGSLSLGGIPRKSDLESPAWAHALANPAHYM